MLLSNGNNINSLIAQKYSLSIPNAANYKSYVRMNNLIMKKPTLFQNSIPTARERLLEHLNNGTTVRPTNEMYLDSLKQQLGTKELLTKYFTKNMTDAEVKKKIEQLINQARVEPDDFKRRMLTQSISRIITLYLTGGIQAYFKNEDMMKFMADNRDNITRILATLNQNNPVVQERPEMLRRFLDDYVDSSIYSKYLRELPASTASSSSGEIEDISMTSSENGDVRSHPSLSTGSLGTDRSNYSNVIGDAVAEDAAAGVAENDDIGDVGDIYATLQNEYENREKPKFERRILPKPIVNINNRVLQNLNIAPLDLANVTAKPPVGYRLGEYPEYGTEEYFKLVKEIQNIGKVTEKDETYRPDFEPSYRELPSMEDANLLDETHEAKIYERSKVGMTDRANVTMEETPINDNKRLTTISPIPMRSLDESMLANGNESLLANGNDSSLLANEDESPKDKKMREFKNNVSAELDDAGNVEPDELLSLLQEPDLVEMKILESHFGLGAVQKFDGFGNSPSLYMVFGEVDGSSKHVSKSSIYEITPIPNENGTIKYQKIRFDGKGQRLDYATDKMWDKMSQNAAVLLFNSPPNDEELKAISTNPDSKKMLIKLRQFANTYDVVDLSELTKNVEDQPAPVIQEPPAQVSARELERTRSTTASRAKRVDTPIVKTGQARPSPPQQSPVKQSRKSPPQQSPAKQSSSSSSSSAPPSQYVKPKTPVKPVPVFKK